MKKWLFICTSLLVAACGSNNNNNNSSPTATPTATTALNPSCLNGTTNCNNNQYNQYYQYGWQAYPTNPYYTNGLGQSYYNGNYRFCNCPTGFVPAYNGSLGLGCVSANYVPNDAYRWSLGYGYSWTFSYGYGFGPVAPVPTGNNMINFGQISNTQGYPATYSCYTNVAQACYVDQANSCGNGAQCIATVGGSRLGICSNSANNNGSGSGLR